jgi:putative ABC transport system ATP-binding protein
MHETAPREVILARSLTKVFGEGEATVHALAGVDLSVPQGQFLAIMGPSGSGKSTLLNVLGGIEVPTEGSISVAGTSLVGLDDDALTVLRRRIGFVFQAFNLLPILTAVENVAFPLILGGRPAAEAHTRAREMLGRFGLERRADSFPATLSGGEQQRVSIARALVVDPMFILADEPTGNLDSAATERTVSLLRGLVDETRKTLVVVTHDPWIATQADRVVLLRDGRLVADFLTEGRGVDEVESLLKEGPS